MRQTNVPKGEAASPPSADEADHEPVPRHGKRSAGASAKLDRPRISSSGCEIGRSLWRILKYLLRICRPLSVRSGGRQIGADWDWSLLCSSRRLPAPGCESLNRAEPMPFVDASPTCSDKPAMSAFRKWRSRREWPTWAQNRHALLPPRDSASGPIAACRLLGKLSAEADIPVGCPVVVVDYISQGNSVMVSAKESGG
jgi:hypothetical protein